MAQQIELLQAFKAWMCQAIHDNKLFSEVVTWDAGLMGLPNEGGGVVPIIGIYTAIPSTMLGEQIVTWASIPANAPITEELVRDFVQQTLEALQQARTKQLQDSLSNSAEATSGGLVVPR